MDNLDIAGILQLYVERCVKAKNTKHLRRIVKNLKELLDLRTIRMEDGDEQADC